MRFIAFPHLTRFNVFPVPGRAIFVTIPGQSQAMNCPADTSNAMNRIVSPNTFQRVSHARPRIHSGPLPGPGDTPWPSHFRGLEGQNGRSPPISYSATPSRRLDGAGTAETAASSGPSAISACRSTYGLSVPLRVLRVSLARVAEPPVPAAGAGRTGRGESALFTTEAQSTLRFYGRPSLPSVSPW